MKNKGIAAIVAIVIAIGFVSYWGLSDNTDGNAEKIKAVVFKSPNCGCCVKYIAYLEKRGFAVETATTDDMDSIKKDHQIPRDMQSCHTMVIGDYFFEGHMPIAAIEKVLSEKPAIDGIALPGMPAGSPGMPGIKKGAFTIYGLSEVVSSEFIKI